MSKQRGALQGVAGMPSALLLASRDPAEQLCASSGLWVWPGWLCFGLGFRSAAGSMPVPSGSTAGACGALLPGPLPSSSGSTAPGAYEPHPGCSVGAAAGSHKPLLVPSGAIGVRICSQSLPAPPPPAHAAALPLLGQCVRVRASWRNDWQVA